VVRSGGVETGVHEAQMADIQVAEGIEVLSGKSRGAELQYPGLQTIWRRTPVHSSFPQTCKKPEFLAM
jgi:hypothetical protein